MKRSSSGTVSVMTEEMSRVKLSPMLLSACICALLTVPVAWSTRTFISSDGISYIEMAENAIQHGAMTLLTNGSWSPAYPALLAVVLKLAHPSRASELHLLRVVDWAICAAAYFCFAYFLANLLRWIHQARGPVLKDRRGYAGILIFAFGLVFAVNLDQALWRVGPNIMVEAVTYLVAGVCIRLSLPDSRFLHQLALGGLLALAYATKAVMFPLALILLGLLLVWPASRQHGRRGTAVAATSFLLLSSLLVVPLSVSRQRLTFSDIGRANIAWYVNDVPRYWDLRLPGFALPHTPKILSTNPGIVKFDHLDNSTYAYWYDPAWWYEGIRGTLNPVKMLRQLLRFLGLIPNPRRNSANMVRLSAQWIALYAGLAAFAFRGLRPRSLYKVLRGQLWLLLWLLAAVLTFAFVHVEHRYILPFVVLGWTVVYVAASVAIGLGNSSGLNRAVAVGVVLVYGLMLAPVLRNKGEPWPAVAGKLTALGIRPGDELASLGFADFAYDARLVGARFTIEILDGNHSTPPIDDPFVYAKLPADDVRRILSVLKANGAKALFSDWSPAFRNDSGWVSIGQNVYVRMLE